MLQAYTAETRREGAAVVGIFSVVDMRDVASSVSPGAAALRIAPIRGYLPLLDAATERGGLDPTTHWLAVDALLNHCEDDDARWARPDQLPGVVGLPTYRSRASSPIWSRRSRHPSADAESHAEWQHHPSASEVVPAAVASRCWTRSATARR
ncbi:hypothetical protein GCM10022236_42030 [Microlunatus ginsengisoli]|uniref:Uncharacterized protein n=1 Tax=Microlunatus ginsengisoli TaxID=363863 RepID=A0ABP7ALJ8_9ACTN